MIKVDLVQHVYSQAVQHALQRLAMQFAARLPGCRTRRGCQRQAMHSSISKLECSYKGEGERLLTLDCFLNLTSAMISTSCPAATLVFTSTHGHIERDLLMNTG